MVKLVALFAAVLALAGCNRGGIETKEAVRQGVVDYIASRTNLNMASMNVDVTAVTFKGNEADATVSFAPKGSGAAQGMSMRYTLERQGKRWVVKGKSDKGGHGAGMGGAMPGGMPPGGMPPSGMGGMSPHGAPGAGETQPPVGQMPPGHPSVKGSEKK